MTAPCDVFRRLFRAALLAAVLVPPVRAEDDVVKEEEPATPAEAPQGLPRMGGRVIIMPGLRLQVGGQGQLQVQGNAGLPGAAAAAEGQKQPYLGVVTGPVAPAVRAQLDLPEGVGLSIEAVAAGGPAEKAGVKQFDVLRKFNDQVIVSPEQLTTLVKVTGAGTKVPLTLVRGGREQVVEAVLEEQVVARGDAGEGIVQVMPGALDLQQMLPPGVAGGLAPQVPADIERRVAEALARAGAGGGMLPRMVPGVQADVRAQMLTIGPDGQSVSVTSDARGSVEIRTAGGKKTVTVKDPEGEEVYSGPLDTEEDLEQVPEDHRDWVREVDAGQPAVRVVVPGAGEPEEEPEPVEAEGNGPTI